MILGQIPISSSVLMGHQTGLLLYLSLTHSEQPLPNYSSMNSAASCIFCFCHYSPPHTVNVKRVHLHWVQGQVGQGWCPPMSFLSILFPSSPSSSSSSPTHLSGALQKDKTSKVGKDAQRPRLTSKSTAHRRGAVLFLKNKCSQWRLWPLNATWNYSSLSGTPSCQRIFLPIVSHYKLAKL